MAPVRRNISIFSLHDLLLHAGVDELVVTMTKVSGNTYNTNRGIKKDVPGHFIYNGTVPLSGMTNWVCGTTNWVYEWDWADRLVKVTRNGAVVLQNWYDANSRRIAKQELVNR